ncbi:MAG: hypothetical protein M4579_003544 [Chaenotheca gracillima]|nr:MAG: hypothetical protein M4579_003544 [Chaenotheca gracillima]
MTDSFHRPNVMGRKPNQLILEHFERGQKLDDASNRYQHTCKACGETFPKGRIDSLTTHLVKKCQAISTEDRLRISQDHDNQAPEHPKRARATAKKIERGKTRQLATRKRPGDPAESTSQAWTPLQTLAEVSRQIDLSEHRDTPAEVQEQSRTTEGINGDGGQIERTGTGHVATENGERRKELTDEDIVRALTSATALPPMFPPGSDPHSRLSSPRLPGLSLPSNLSDNAGSPALDSHSPSIRGPMEPELSASPRSAGISDRFFNNRSGGPRSSTTWPMIPPPMTGEGLFFEGLPHRAAPSEGAPSRAATFPRLIAMDPNSPHGEYSSDYNVNGRTIRPKVRGRFSVSRRKEVQEVRKRGACIRCRMLKKPVSTDLLCKRNMLNGRGQCSGESPCSTCQNVESARLWKQPCIRTRIADELELYSAGLHAVLAHHAVNEAKRLFEFRPTSDKIETTYFLESTDDATFGALCGHSNGLDPWNNSSGSEPKTLWLLDGEKDDLAGKLESYVKKMSPVFVQREPSPFMRSTLALASELAIDKKDQLLGLVLDLWSLTHSLVDIELEWKITRISDPQIGGERTPIDAESDGRSYNLLCTQLRSAAEKKAAQLSKTILNELERRLLQRSQSGNFETFLVALCMLNCVERATWLFTTWDNEEYTTKWPLDHKPSYFTKQSEHFADMLQMLLKMRGLPPKTDPQAGDNTILIPKNIETTEEVVQNYFQSIGLTSTCHEIPPWT